MGDTALDTNASSESSSGNDQPRASLSRLKSNRTLHNRRSAKWLKLEKSRRERLANFLTQKLAHPSSSDDDERISAAASYAPLLEARARANASSHSRLGGPQRRKARHALRNLPRPAEVVPDLGAGSASDAGFDKCLKESHRRRVKSTEVVIQYLNRDGTQDPVPPWTHDIHGLKRYTRYMFPPPEDQNIQAPRVPIVFLSRAYRGSLLKNCTTGTTTRKRNKGTKSATVASSRQSGLTCASSTDHMSIEDFEYWATTSDSELEVKSSALRKQGEPARSRQTEVRTPNNELVQEALAEHASDSSNSENSNSRASSVSSASPQEPEPADEPLAEEEGPDHLSELFKMVEENPNTLFGTKTKLEDTYVNTQTEKEELTLKHGSKERGEGEKSEFSHLSPYERERKKADEFCGGPVARPECQRKVVINILKMEESLSHSNAIDPSDSKGMKASGYDISSKPLRMMQKMGFKGRLGAKEDGILEPIKARTAEGRLGLGLRFEHDVHTKNSASTFPHILRGNHTHVAAVDVKETPARPNKRAKHVSKRKRGLVDHTGGKLVPAVDLDAKSQHKKQKRIGALEQEKSTNDQNEPFADNGRRAILIDMDVLVTNSVERRLNAFGKVFRAIDGSAGGFNLNAFLKQHDEDFCDRDYVLKYAQAAGLGTVDSMITKLHEDLDTAYREGSEPEWDEDILRALKQNCKKINYGFFHRGSQKRMAHEVASLGSKQRFLNQSRVCVKKNDEWPYIASWQDLLCQVGVPARQAAFLVGGEQSNGETLVGGVVASSVLKGNALLLSRVNGSLELHLFGYKPGEEVLSAVVGKDHELLFKSLSKKVTGSIAKRHVLALSSSDGLWYAGREEFGLTHAYGKSRSSSFITFYDHGSKEWVENDCVLELTTEHYCKMRETGFAGILDPADVEDL